MEEDSVKMHEHPDYIGITDYTTSYPYPGEDENILQKFNEVENRKKIIQERKRKINCTDEDAAAYADNVAASYKVGSEYGEDVHSIFQYVLLGKPVSSITFKRLTNPAQIKEFEDMAKDFKQRLLDKYGKNSKFYCEFSVGSIDIEPSIKAILESKGKKGISGTIDLLVRAEDGSTHIYDFKTSRHPVGNWNEDRKGTWHRNKKKQIANQLAGYNAILQQKGCGNSTTHVVPILMDYSYDDNGNITELSSFEMEEQIDNIPETTMGSIYNQWRMIFRTPFKFDTNSMIENDRQIKYLLQEGIISRDKIERETKDMEWFKENRVIKISRESSEYEKGHRYKLYPIDLGKRKPIYWDSDEAMEDGIRQYHEDVLNNRSNQMDAIATNIERVLKGEITFQDMDDALGDTQGGYLSRQLERYLREGWEFVRNKDLNAYGIFIFRKSGRSEVIGFTTERIGTQHKLSLGTTILGNHRVDTQVNTKEILPATNGAMELMRLMNYIANNQDQFRDFRISQVKVINPWDATYVTYNNSMLVENYNLLVSDGSAGWEGNTSIPTLDTSLFWGDVTSLLAIADELLKIAQDNNLGLYEFSMEGQIGNGDNYEIEKWIENQINYLKRRHVGLAQGDHTDVDDHIVKAYYYLNAALLAVRGNQILQEADAETWLKGTSAGVNISSTGFSPSANIRQFDDLMQAFSTDVRMKVQKTLREIIPPLKKFYDSKMNIKTRRILGGEQNYFLEWFVKDESGNIDQSFKLMDPYSSEFKGSEESREALDTWLRVLNSVRYPKQMESPEEIQKLKDSGKYYEVPLTEAVFTRQAKRLGIIKALKNKWDQYTELTEDVFAGESDIKAKWYSDLEHGRSLYNKFALDSETRKRKLNDKGVGFFETDLERVLFEAVTAYTKSEISYEYIPRLNAMQTVMKLSQSYSHVLQDQTEKALDKLIKSKFYGEPIIEGKGLQAWAKWLNVVKKGLSMLALGVNFRSFLRETLQGAFMGFSRSVVEQIPGITWDTYLDAFEYVTQEVPKNIDSVSLLQQLDARYGVANYSLNNIARKSKLNWTGIRNWSTDTLFWGSTSPDFLHRMTILIAKMMSDGVFDRDMSKSAYYLNENGDLVYDWKRDKRFTAYVNNDKSNSTYLDQKGLYLGHIAELNNASKRYTDEFGNVRSYREGDMLPDAYLQKEIQAIKNYSDLLYGHYDDETRALVHDMFLGSFFMQYKTYITSRIEQWTMKPGTYNTEMYEAVVDPVYGEKLYKVHSKELGPDGMPQIEIKRESEIANIKQQLIEEGRIETYYRYKGMPMEGIGYAMWQFIKGLGTLNMETLNEVFANPIRRDNFILGLHDLVFAQLMMMLITAIFGVLIEGVWTTDSKKVAKAAQKEGYLTSLSYNVLNGAWQDFDIVKNLAGIATEWNPSAVISALRIGENTKALILGNKTLFQAATRTVGALGDLKGVADMVAEA